MGYSVLYIAFGVVALWLLGEVLLQYKARLRWRLLAFAGFMGVVGGVALREVAVILLGAVAFGTGQTFVTLSYKRGFSTGWALGGRPGSSRRRRGAPARAAEPTLAVTPVEESREETVPGGADVLAEGPGTTADDGPSQVYQPVPIHDDSGEYPLYDGQSSYTPDPYTSGGYEGYGAQGYAGWGVDPQPAPAAAGYEGYEQPGEWGGQGYGYGQGGYQNHEYGDYAQSGYGTGHPSGDWQPPPAAGQEPQPYAGQGYGYDPQAQPYIPQQQHQSPYEQPRQGQQDQPQPPQPQPQYTGEYDPYDPYRF